LVYLSIRPSVILGFAMLQSIVCALLVVKSKPAPIRVASILVIWFAFQGWVLLFGSSNWTNKEMIMGILFWLFGVYSFARILANSTLFGDMRIPVLWCICALQGRRFQRITDTTKQVVTTRMIINIVVYYN
jgi:hypothetical protein